MYGIFSIESTGLAILPFGPPNAITSKRISEHKIVFNGDNSLQWLFSILEDLDKKNIFLDKSVGDEGFKSYAGYTSAAYVLLFLKQENRAKREIFIFFIDQMLTELEDKINKESMTIESLRKELDNYEELLIQKLDMPEFLIKYLLGIKG